MACAACRIVLSSPSVGATETALMGAVLARGETEILNAARDPEVADLAACLAAMGARIEGAGTHRMLVQGVDALRDGRHDLITDRIEAGTYAIAAAITGGHLEILGAHLEHLGAVGAVLEAYRRADLANRSRPDGRARRARCSPSTSRPSRIPDSPPTCRRNSWR